MFKDIIKPSTFIAPYIVACYDDSLFCDLKFICAGNRSVTCHKMVLCSLSKKLLEICEEGEEAGETSYIQLPDFSHEDVRATVDEVYASILKKEVVIQKTEVMSVLGIEANVELLKIQPSESESESGTRERFTVEEAFEFAKRCERSSVAAKEMCEALMSTTALTSPSLEGERMRVYDNVRKKLDHCLDKKRKKKYRQERLKMIFISRDYSPLFSRKYLPVIDSRSSDDVQPNDEVVNVELMQTPLIAKTEVKVEEEVFDLDGDYEGSYIPDIEMDDTSEVLHDDHQRGPMEEEDSTKEYFGVTKYNEYQGTRSQFWKEDYVKNTLAGIYHEDLSIKDAADRLGLSYATLYAKYKDRFGPLNAKRHKHLVPYNNNQPRTAPEKKEFSLGSLNIIEYNEYSGKRDEFWREHFVSVLMNAVHGEELKMSDAAELLGISQSIFNKRYTEVFGNATSSQTSTSSERVMGDDFVDEVKTFENGAIDEEYEGTEAEGGRQGTYTTRSGRRTRQMVFDSEGGNDSSVEPSVGDNAKYEKSEDKKVGRKRGRPGEHITGPSAEQLLLREEDPEVVRLQRELESREAGELDGPSPSKRKKVKEYKCPECEYAATGSTRSNYIYARRLLKKHMKDAHGQDTEGIKIKGRCKTKEMKDTNEVKDEDYEPSGGEESEEESESGDERNQSAPNDKLHRDLKLYNELRKIVSECQPKQIKVKRANNSFNLCPVEVYGSTNSKGKPKLDGWRNFRGGNKVPSFAAIVGVKRSSEDDIDPRLVKFNGELLTGLPLAWSLPENVEELDEHFDAVTDAYRRVLGFSEEEIYCNQMFFKARESGLVMLPKTMPKEFRRGPKAHVTHNLSMKFRNMDKDSLQKELERRTGGEETPADQRKESMPDLNLQHDRCRLKLDKNLRSDAFEGLMVVAWHADGQPVGKVLNFDDNKDIFVSILKDVWTRVTNRFDYKLPFSHHVVRRYASVYERALAPRLLRQLIDGTAPSMICPHCGKMFTVLVARDREMYEKHVQLHELGSCGCEEAAKIDTLAGMDRHMKVHHSDGKYAQCSVPNCLHVCLKEFMDNHVTEMHMVNIVCEECGMVFTDRKEYRNHRDLRHKYSDCKVCGEKVQTSKMSGHMIASHRGDPVPCPTCGAKFADEKNLKRHILNLHLAKEKKAFQCPYPECDKAFGAIHSFMSHLNNIHFKVYAYVCEFRCADARYKDESNLRHHYKKRHGQTLHGVNNPSLEEYLRTMSEEDRVYHESILSRSEHYKKLVARKRSGGSEGKTGRPSISYSLS